jgi:hypothetical protein
MKNKLSDLYAQILLSEAEKSALQTPSNDTVGSVKGGQELFGSKPDTKKVSTGKVKGETPKALEHETTEEEDVNPKTSEKNVAGAVAPTKSAEEAEGVKSKPKGLGEEVTMGAFETLFRKTLVIEDEETLEFEAGSEAPSEEGSLEHEASETEEEEVAEDDDEDEEDLLTDLRKLQTHVTDIITKLEKAVEDESGETTEDAGYSEEDFNEEFGEEAPEGEESEEEVKTESLKVLGDKKKALQSKNNKVGGKVNPKGGKANTGKFHVKPEIKVLGDKKKSLQKGNAVKSSLKKGDSFIK